MNNDGSEMGAKRDDIPENKIPPPGRGRAKVLVEKTVNVNPAGHGHEIVGRS